MKIIAVMATLLASCGAQIKVKGSTEHTVGGTATVVNQVVLTIDVAHCAGLPDVPRMDCIKDTVDALGDLAELIKTLTEAEQ